MEFVDATSGNVMLQHCLGGVDIHHLNFIGILVKVKFRWLLGCCTSECYILSFGGHNRVELEEWRWNIWRQN